MGRRAASGFRRDLPTRWSIDGTRFPFSVLNLDIWGEDIDDSARWSSNSGDARTAILKPTERGYHAHALAGSPHRPVCQSGCSAKTANPMRAIPRHALSHRGGPLQIPRPDPGLSRWSWNSSSSTIRARRCKSRPRPARASAARRPRSLSIRALDAFDTFFTDLYDACEAMDIPADTSTSETGLGPVRSEPDALRRPAARGR